MTLFSACLSRLGLSIAQAARLLDVPENTIKSLSSGRRAVPIGMWDDLRAYERRIGERSIAIEDAFEEAGGSATIVDQRTVSGDRIGMLAAADFVLNAHVDPTLINFGLRSAEHDA